MLQEFLNNNFITLTDDTNLVKLKKASDEIVKRLNKTKSKIISYTLVALDPDTPIDNQDIKEVNEVITKYWPTFSANTKDTPVTYIRAVMLQSLETISADLHNACLIWHSGRNSVRRYNLGHQKNLLMNFVTFLGNKIETEAVGKWSLPSESKGDKTILDVKNLQGDAIDKTELDKNLREVRSTINKLLGEAQVEIEQRRVLQLKTHLLWWKEASYSHSLTKSYSGLDPWILQVVLAIDYSTFVPFVHPLSVDYFLREVNLDLINRDDKKAKLTEVFKSIEVSTELKSLFSGYEIEQGRICLLNFVKGMATGVYSSKQFKALVGLKESEEISISEFSLWIFHDLLAHKIINPK